MSAMKTRQMAGHLAIAAILLVACLGAMLPSASKAQGPLPWRAEYFNNRNLTGQPVFVQNEAAIDHAWENNSPNTSAGIPFDGFSVRWTALMWFDAGTYLFKAYTDDGVRLWVDGQVLIDQWRDQSVTLNQQQLSLSAGNHSVRVEYYDNIGNATAMVWWERISGPTSTSWRAEYFNNPWLVGEPVLVRGESEINYDWGSNAPAPNVSANNFSVRWTSTVSFEASGTYTFSATSEDGVRAWVDGGLLLEGWRDQSATTVTASRYVTQAPHPVIVEYYKGEGTGSVKFSWQRGSGTPAPSGPTQTPVPGSPTQTPVPGSPTQTPVPSGDIIVDDKSSGFSLGGPSSSWYERSVGYNGHSYWTYNSDVQAYNFAKWMPQLPRAGNYQVYAFVPKQQADTRSARYRLSHNGQEHSYWIDQSVYFDRWVSLGTYYFVANGNEYVYLDDVTGEPYASHKIGFDAVKFVSKEGGVTPTSVPPTATPAAPTATPVGPTATAMPPTATPVGPTATPVPPTRTPVPPTPTPTLPACPITPILGFGGVWSSNATVRARLGCPVEVENSHWSAEETFVGGYMFWRSDLLLVYAMYGDGTWQSFADTWQNGDLEWDPMIVPPSGLYQPKRGFGKVWREQPGVRDKLGWATSMERGLGADYQGYQGGLMLWSDLQGIFVLYNDGTWSHYR